jgi:single-strand DNA-binding protein
MARGVNKVILIGNLGIEPDFKQSSAGVSIANASIATSDSWKDKDGSTQERTEWHRLVFFNRLAEIVRDYVKKGSKIYVEGRLQTRKWEDKTGVERYTTEIVVSEMQMLDKISTDSTSSTSSANKPKSQPKKQDFDYISGEPYKNKTTTSVQQEEFDDDIPF